MNTSPQDRLSELLAEAALFGVSANERLELTRLLDSHPNTDTTTMEQAAAMLELSSLPVDCLPMPAGLADKLKSTANSMAGDMAKGLVGDAIGTSFESSTSSQPNASTKTVAPSEVYARSSGPGSMFPWIGWAVAAGLLVALLWPPSTDAPIAKLTAAQKREVLLKRSPGFYHPWSATKHRAANGAQGDVVWSNASQEGYMRIAGLASNDTGVEQYQLWIFDADQKHPIDGGVFDMPADATEVVIPISAKLGVSKPTLFAVTVEKPGGVVVSDQKRIVLTSQAPEA